MAASTRWRHANACTVATCSTSTECAGAAGHPDGARADGGQGAGVAGRRRRRRGHNSVRLRLRHGVAGGAAGAQGAPSLCPLTFDCAPLEVAQSQHDRARGAPRAVCRQHSALVAFAEPPACVLQPRAQLRLRLRLSGSGCSWQHQELLCPQITASRAGIAHLSA
jgi:hypothetical protein